MPAISCREPAAAEAVLGEDRQKQKRRLSRDLLLFHRGFADLSVGDLCEEPAARFDRGAKSEIERIGRTVESKCAQDRTIEDEAMKTKAKARKPDIGSELIAGMENALAHARGRKRAARETVVRAHVPEQIDVAALRRRLGMSQAVFAARFGFSVKNIQNWEQGSRQPEGPARAYLLVIDRNPKAVQDALSKAN